MITPNEISRGEAEAEFAGFVPRLVKEEGGKQN
jgi:hypothetical protein